MAVHLHKLAALADLDRVNLGLTTECSTPLLYRTPSPHFKQVTKMAVHLHKLPSLADLDLALDEDLAEGEASELELRGYIFIELLVGDNVGSTCLLWRTWPWSKTWLWANCVNASQL